MESKKLLVIHPFAKQMRNGEKNPKNYCYWQELIKLINMKFPDYHIVQVGIDGEEQLVEDFRKNLSLNDLEKLIDESSIWIGVDSFFQHLAWARKKRGIVIFGQSDPLIFGHPENINILKDRKYLRNKQFWLWEQSKFNEEVFVKPEEIIKYL